MNKLKSFLSTSDSLKSSTKQKNVNKYNNNDKLEPEVGFKLTLDPGSKAENGSNNNNVPELIVHLIGARHLPSCFGLKSVEGYMVKIKLFPGASRFDSSVQLTSWPNFDETFKFPLGPTHKSSIRIKNRRQNNSNSNTNNDNNGNETIPEKIFKGNFVVFTVFALLDLPAGTGSSMKEKYNNFKRQGSLMLKNKPVIGKLIIDDCSNESDPKKDAQRLTTSESQRNIGSVTCFLDPKYFIENTKTKLFLSEEMWMPIRDITVAPAADSRVSISSSPKGQVEISLQLCDYNQITFGHEPSPQEDKNFDINGPSTSIVTSPSFKRKDLVSSNHSSSTKSRFSFSDMKKMVKKQKDKQQKGLLFKISTTKMRCSIKVKEEFENVADRIYIKTTVFERDILSSSKKSDLFLPTLSKRWDPDDTSITIPMITEDNLSHVSIKVSIATKTKVGKKIVLGTLHLGPNAKGSRLEHWDKMIASKCLPVTMWHSFE